MKLEIIAFDIESCFAIQKSGAHRVELCANAPEGGTTPSAGFIKQARKILSIELYPIIRPRGGDFLYNEEEFECMLHDVKLSKELGCDGVVSGFLKEDGTIDKERTKRIVEAAYPMGVTFHRAFDRVMDFEQALEDVIECGCERILTSGGFPNVMDGLLNIKKFMELADDRIIIMPGSGVRSSNIQKIIAETNATEIHSSARMQKLSAMKFQSSRMEEQLNSYSVDENEVLQMIAAMKN